MTPYTAPDQSAAAGVPAGWQVTNGVETVILMSGPKGEATNLGTAAMCGGLAPND